MKGYQSITVKGHFENQAMTLEDLTGQIKIIQDVMKNIMKEGEHYGAIPGCGPKPALHKPGAEKLCVVFRLAPSYDFKKTELRNAHREYEFVCTLTHIPSGAVVGQGVGSCSTMESKYRYRLIPLKCPKCGNEDTVIKGKEEYGGGWLCFGKKGGCGAKFNDGDPEIENQERGKIEHVDPADYYNTIMKMAKKRSHVDAVLTATAASDIFTGVDDDKPEKDPEKSGKDKKEQLKPANKPGDIEMPTAADYKRLYAVGRAQRNPVSETEIKKIAEWYRKVDKLSKSELNILVKNFNKIFNEYLSSLKPAQDTQKVAR